VIVGGIDPGLGGGLAVVNGHHDCETTLMPVIDGVVDGAAALRWLVERDVEFVVIEDVLTLGKWGAKAGLTFGMAIGGVRTVGQIICCTPRLVKPQEWKKAWGLIKTDKTASRELAAKLFPHAADQFKRVKDDGRAEAALIAAYHLGLHQMERAA
jgi:crossover junction endodeoxyribonuclease RuvC